MSLTGDELTINEKSYTIQYKNGETFFVGKLLKREKFFSPFHGCYSLYNTIFEFEQKPDMNLVLHSLDAFHNQKMFYGTNHTEEV